MTEEKIRYLEMLQGAINRIASNSASIKNWFVLSVGGLIAIYYTHYPSLELLIIAFIISSSFYLFDVYYLWLEGVFIYKYNLALKSDKNIFDMDIKESKKAVSLWKPILSLSMIPYWVLLVLIILLMILH